VLGVVNVNFDGELVACVGPEGIADVRTWAAYLDLDRNRVFEPAVSGFNWDLPWRFVEFGRKDGPV
jgi:hypothetical protein